MQATVLTGVVLLRRLETISGHLPIHAAADASLEVLHISVSTHPETKDPCSLQTNAAAWPEEA